MQKVAIYARVSTQKQEKENTIASQVEQLENYAKEKEYFVVKKYTDNGYSGELLSRPALDKLRDDAQKELFDAALITCPDRLARKYIYKGLVEEELEKKGIEVIYLNRPIGHTPEDRLLSDVQGAVAEYEKAKFLERTRRGRLHKAKLGLIIGNRAPYGYKYIKKTENKAGYYELNKEEAKIVKMMFEWVAYEGLSSRDVIRKLYQLEIYPRNGARKWAKSSTLRILKNETYAGITYYNKHEPVEPVTHLKKGYKRAKRSSQRLRPRKEWIPIPLPKELHIIDRETFELVQERLAKNRVLSPRNNTKNHYLLRGLVQCGTCSSLFTGDTHKDYRAYRCSNRNKTFPNPQNCKAERKWISARILEPLIWKTLWVHIKSPKLILKQIKRLQKQRPDMERELQKEIERIESKFSELKNEEERIIKAFRERVINLEQLNNQLKDIKKSKQRLSQEKVGMEKQKREVETSQIIPKTLEEACKRVSDNSKNLNFEQKQNIIRSFVDRVVIKGNEVEIDFYLSSDFGLTPQFVTIGSRGCGHNKGIGFRINESLSRRLNQHK